MSNIQKLFMAILPPTWAASMQADSRLWMVRCGCGSAISLWDIGGIRWKATGNQRTYRSCSKCGKYSWQIISREPEPGNERDSKG
jgi:hypothetical protein